jgi:hypothetical protein
MNLTWDHVAAAEAAFTLWFNELSRGSAIAAGIILLFMALAVPTLLIRFVWLLLRTVFAGFRVLIECCTPLGSTGVGITRPAKPSPVPTKRELRKGLVLLFIQKYKPASSGAGSRLVVYSQDTGHREVYLAEDVRVAYFDENDVVKHAEFGDFTRDELLYMAQVLERRQEEDGYIYSYQRELKEKAKRAKLLNDVFADVAPQPAEPEKAAYVAPSCDGHIPSQRSFENRSDPKRSDREPPADDLIAVDNEWLQSIGFAEDNTACLRIESKAAGPVFTLCVDLDHGCDGWSLEQRVGKRIWTVCINQQETRGGVRRLCEALGIPLKHKDNKGEYAWAR